MDLRSDLLSTAKTKSKSTNPVRKFLGVLGPGFITVPPMMIHQGLTLMPAAGASTGFSTLRLALVTFPMMAAIQFICAKIAMVTGRGLAGVLKEHYSRWLLYPTVLFLVVANTAN
jgi:Mn2+/Fe2+ NRAMP family transporter